MKWISWGIPSSVLLAIALIGGTPEAEAETRDDLQRIFEVEAGGQLIIEVEDGDIEVKGTEENRMAVEVLRRARAKDVEDERAMLENHVVTFHQDNNRVTITGERKHRRNFWNLITAGSLDVRYIISVPRVFDVELTTSDGDVSVDELKGVLELVSSDGDLKLGDVRGGVRAGTSDGNIVIDKFVGDLHLRSSDGDIRIGSVEGDLVAETSDGNIEVKEIKGELEAKTSDGDIKVIFADSPGGPCRLKTSDGNIRVRLVEDATVELDARTGDGRIYSEFPLSERNERREGVLRGKINGGGPQLYIKTNDGDIDLKKL
jgi:DUF4097 and DUF4098 domain-containing protein YvlB